MYRGTHDVVADERNEHVLIYVNGELVPRAQAKISVFDSGFLIGDGIWEGLRLHYDVLVFLGEHQLKDVRRPDDTAVLSDRQGVHTSCPNYFFLERYTEAYLEEMRSFVSAIRENRSPMVTGQDGKAPIVIGLVAKKSLDEKRPVRLKEIEG